MSLFKNIFKKKEDLVPVDLSFLGTDIHSHLIPDIDDGAKAMGDSNALAQGLVDLGYKKAITTPHIMSDYYRNTPDIIRSGLAEINQSFSKNNISLEVNCAAEYYIDYDFVSKIGKEELLTFGDNYILVEFSFMQAPLSCNDALFALQTNGYKPVLAHPERYIYWYKTPKVLFDLKERDILFQINLLSLMGVYGVESAIMGETLINNNFVEWLGTDLHNVSQMEMLKKYKLKESLAEKLTNRSYLNQSL
jgi:protein-tyrosine phosphatase